MIYYYSSNVYYIKLRLVPCFEHLDCFYRFVRSSMRRVSASTSLHRAMMRLEGRGALTRTRPVDACALLLIGSTEDRQDNRRPLSSRSREFYGVLKVSLNYCYLHLLNPLCLCYSWEWEPLRFSRNCVRFIRTHMPRLSRHPDLHYENTVKQQMRPVNFGEPKDKKVTNPKFKGGQKENQEEVHGAG